MSNDLGIMQNTKAKLDEDESMYTIDVLLWTEYDDDIKQVKISLPLNASNSLLRQLQVLVPMLEEKINERF